MLCHIVAFVCFRDLYRAQHVGIMYFLSLGVRGLKKRMKQIYINWAGILYLLRVAKMKSGLHRPFSKENNKRDKKMT